MSRPLSTRIDKASVMAKLDGQASYGGFIAMPSSKCTAIKDGRTLRKRVLINARARIAEPACWTSCAAARTADRREVEWDDPSATQWCAVGAVCRAAYDLVGERHEALRITKEILETFHASYWRTNGGLASINDVGGHAAVLAVLSQVVQTADPHRKAGRRRKRR